MKWEKTIRPELSEEEQYRIYAAYHDIGTVTEDVEEMIAFMSDETSYVGYPFVEERDAVRELLAELRPYLRDSRNEHLRRLWTEVDMGINAFNGKEEHTGEWFGLSSLLEDDNPYIPKNILFNAERYCFRLIYGYLTTEEFRKARTEREFPELNDE